MKIRLIEPAEVMLLTDFIYEAIYQPDPKQRLPRTIIQDPAIWVYVDGFGTSKDDHCLVAEVEHIIVGAVWVRCMQAFGHIADGVPEFAISVYPEYRGMGIGTELMKEMLKLLRKRGYGRTSLAVQKDNYAVNMYQQVGFVTCDENEQEYIMVCNL